MGHYQNLSVDIGRKEVIGQLARYCFGEGMDYGVLTNGASWILFRAFEKDTKTEDRVLWKANIVSDKLAETIRRLNTISNENIENIDELIKKLPILDEIWQYLLAESGKMIEGVILFLTIIKEHGGPEHERQGPLHWKTIKGELLHELNEKVREKRGDRM
ncbi:MAG: hypothetical protein JW878_09335 [Methanomicrobia archaeon]|nr:hypothetical protein [Methanomicrobia archaeon]